MLDVCTLAVEQGAEGHADGRGRFSWKFSIRLAKHA